MAKTGTGKYTRFDAADYLEDLDDVATYLQIALQESAGDPTAIPRALGVMSSGGPEWARPQLPAFTSEKGRLPPVLCRLVDLSGPALSPHA